MTQPVALITGCSSGIGRALADAFQAAGYCVWASARKAEDLAALSAAGMDRVVEQFEQPHIEDIPKLAGRLPQPTDEQHDGHDMADQHGAWVPVAIDERARHGNSLCSFMTGQLQARG